MRALFKLRTSRLLVNNQASLLKQWLSMGGYQATRLILGIFLTGFLARTFGPDHFGLYISISSLAIVFQSIASGGVQTIIIQKSSGCSVDSQNRTIVAALYIRLAYSFLASLLWPICILILYPAQIWLSLLLLPFIFLSFIEVLNYRLISIHRSDLNATFNSIAFVVFLLSHSLFFIWPQINYLGLGMALLSFEWVAIFLLLIGFSGPSRLLKAYRSERWKRIVKPIFFYSIPILISTIVYLIQQRMSLVFVDKLSTNYQSSLFAAAQKLGYLPQTLTMVLFTPLLPKLANSLNKGKYSLFAKQLQKFSLIILLSGIISLSIFALFSDFWIKTVFGTEYQGANVIFLVLLTQSALMLQRPILDRVLTVMGKAKLVMNIYLISLLLQIPFSFYLIPLFGALGAAASLCISTLIGGWILPILFSKTSRSILIAPYKLYKG